MKEKISDQFLCGVDDVFFFSFLIDGYCFSFVMPMIIRTKRNVFVELYEGLVLKVDENPMRSEL